MMLIAGWLGFVAVWMVVGVFREVWVCLDCGCWIVDLLGFVVC